MLFENLLIALRDDENIKYICLGSLVGGIFYYIIRKILQRFRSSKLKIIKAISNLGLISLLKSNLSFNKKYYYPSGLTNYHNNCYINVFLQSISCLPEFVNFSFKERSIFIQKFIQTLSFINSSSSKSISQDEFIGELTEKFKFASEQQDCYELYHRLLDCYSPDLESINPLFIDLETKLYCARCKMVLIKKERQIDISIEAQDNTMKSVQNELTALQKIYLIADYVCSCCTIESLINQLDFFKDKQFVAYLESIKRRDENLDNLLQEIVAYADLHNFSFTGIRFKPVQTTLQKSTSIVNTGKNLVIQVGYVSATGKSNARILFSDYINVNDKKYELVSFIVHVGSSSFGHYFCYRKFYDRWIVANDSTVKFVDKSAIFESSRPYMLFYRQIY